MCHQIRMISFNKKNFGVLLMKQAYITLVGRSAWAVVNSYYFMIHERKCDPDLVLVFFRLTVQHIKGTITNLTQVLSVPLIKLAVLQMKLWGVYTPDFKITLEWPNKSIEDKKVLADIAKEGVDRQALSLGTFAEIFGKDPKKERKQIEEDIEWQKEIAADVGVNNERMTPPGLYNMPPEEPGFDSE